MPSTRPATTQTLLGSAEAAAARRLDRDHILRVEIHRRLRRELEAVQEVAPRCAVAPAPHAFRLAHAPLADDAVASAPFAGAAGPEPEPVALHAQRVLQLERLDRGGERVRH